MTSTPRFIYFDLGNVLFYFDYDRACRQIAEVSGAPVDLVRAVVFESDLQHRYETGEVSSRQFHEEFSARTRTNPDFEQLKFAGSAMFQLNCQILPLLTQLRAAGHRMGVLSNTCESHWEYVTDGRYSILPGMFHIAVLSFHVGAAKPSEKIFDAAADLAQVRPHEIFFTDDRAENIAAAIEFGFDAVQFHSVKELERELRSRKVDFNL